jgi:hypothetical protein
MDIISINDGKFRIDEYGGIYVNYMKILDPHMIDDKIFNVTNNLVSKNMENESRILNLQTQLLDSNELINALLYILVEKSVLKDVSDVNQMIQEIRDSRKVVDVLVKAGEMNNAK